MRNFSIYFKSIDEDDENDENADTVSNLNNVFRPKSPGTPAGPTHRFSATPFPFSNPNIEQGQAPNMQRRFSVLSAARQRRNSIVSVVRENYIDVR